MALRVLLADESTTIKKVIQLALQDYAVQVRSVNVGTDALNVAKSFEPDLVLADVLLPKKNGYEVCLDIKNDSALGKTPVVLMWSSFMELDQSLFSSCGADDRLEKPFNVESLRALVQKWVPKTQEQKVSEYLHFPTTITEMEVEPTRLTGPGFEPTEIMEQPQSIALEEAPTGDWDMDAFEDISKFVPTDHLIQKTQAPDKSSDGIGEKTNLAPMPQPLSEDSLPELPADPSPQVFKMDIIPTDDEDEEAMSVDLHTLNQAPVNVQDLMTQREALRKAAEAASQSSATVKASPTNDAPTPALQPQEAPPLLSQEQLETLLRAQSREIIEAVVWKVVPEMAGQLIRKELERLMAEE